MKGECRARRAGKILDIGVDGYYRTEICTPNFIKVLFIKYMTIKAKIYNLFQAVEVCKGNYGGKYTPVIVTDWSPITYPWVRSA